MSATPADLHIPVTLHVTEKIEHEIKTVIPAEDLEELQEQGVDLADRDAVLVAWVRDLDPSDEVLVDAIGDSTVDAVIEREVAVSPQL